MRTAAVAFFAALATSPSIARAAEPASIDYSAPSSCPDRRAFLAEIRARTDELEDAPNASRRFIVRITADDHDRVRGSLTIERSGRSGSPRAIDARSCDEALRFIAFLVALVLDPDAKPPRPPDETTMNNALRSEADVRGPPEQHEAAPASSRTAVATAAPPPVAGSKPPERTNGEERRTWSRWSAGTSVDVAGLGIGPVVGAGLFGGVRPLRWLDLRVALRQTLSATVTSKGTSSTFGWTTGRVEPCAKVYRIDRLDIGPCVHVDLGRVEGAGGGTGRVEKASRLWFSGGFSALAQLVVIDPIILQLTAGLFATFVRTAFVYQPGFVAYRPPNMGVHAALGVGVRWR